MANLSRPKPKADTPATDPYTIARDHERQCVSPLEQQGHQTEWDAKQKRYVHIGEVPDSGHIEECMHGWVLHVTRRGFNMNMVSTLKPGDRRYRKAKRIIRRERRAKVIEERRAGQAETA